jgi:hypothetical protein
MKRSHFVPESWKLSAKLRLWTKSKGLTDKMIDDEVALFRRYEWTKPKSDFNRCWQTRILLGLKKGWIELPREYKMRQPEELSDDDRQQAQIDFDNDPKVIAWRAKR